MQRSIGTLVVALVLLATAQIAPARGASAAPNVEFGARLIATGASARAGEGAPVTFQAEYTISGSGYGARFMVLAGGTPPLSAIDVLLPEGLALDYTGYGSCPESALLNVGLSACRRNSIAGPRTGALAEVAFGTERVPESLSLTPVLTGNGTFAFLAYGSSPVSVEAVWPASLTPAAPPSHQLELKVLLPALATVPGAPLVSLRTLRLVLGSIDEGGENAVSYLELPASCPSGGFAVESQLTFGGSFGGAREFGVPAETVSASAKAPCPQGSSSPPQEALPGTGGAITAPSNKVCLSRRDFRIHVQQIGGLTYRRVEVVVNGRSVKVLRGRRASARVDLRGLPKGRYVVRITVWTTSGRRISGIRAYHTCAPKPLPGGKPRLQLGPVFP